MSMLSMNFINEFKNWQWTYIITYTLLNTITSTLCFLYHLRLNFNHFQHICKYYTQKFVKQAHPQCSVKHPKRIKNRPQDIYIEKSTTWFEQFCPFESSLGVPFDIMLIKPPLVVLDDPVHRAQAFLIGSAYHKQKDYNFIYKEISEEMQTRG